MDKLKDRIKKAKGTKKPKRHAKGTRSKKLKGQKS